MAHCPPELLDDLRELFAEVRSWEGVLEKNPGVLYVGTQPFLHFHLLPDGRRRADIKGRTDWVQVELPTPISAGARRTLLRHLREQFAQKRQRTAARGGRPSA